MSKDLLISAASSFSEQSAQPSVRPEAPGIESVMDVWSRLSEPMRLMRGLEQASQVRSSSMGTSVLSALAR